MKRAWMVVVLLPGCSRDPPAADDVDAAVHVVFDALKRDDFGLLLPLLPTESDVAWIRTNGSSPFPIEGSAETAASALLDPDDCAADVVSRIRDRFDSARMRGRGYSDALPTFHPPTPEDWVSATFDGLAREDGADTPIEVASVDFLVRVDEETQHVLETLVAKVDRGWVILDLKCKSVRRTGVAAKLADIYTETKAKIEALISLREIRGEPVDGPPPEMSEFGRDPWGRNYRLEVIGHLGSGRLRIWSDGPDRIQGTADDRCVPPRDFVWREPSLLPGR